MANNFHDIQGVVCPIPLPHKEKIVLGHGSGGKMSLDLISSTFFPPLDNPILRAANDGGIVETEYEQPSGGTSIGRLAISTDSHVVWPLFFPGGDIGRLAICGTVNDISMMGAVPKYLTAGFILEEGLEISVLENILQSMKQSAQEAAIKIIAGDTKVVEKGKGDSLYINTTGFGILPHGINISGDNAKAGDVVILSGTIGDHGIAVLEARGDLGFKSDIESDIAPLNGIVQNILDISSEIHTMRDPTRGGLATSLNEIAKQSNVGIEIDEETIPVQPAVQSACELLGFDPLYIANEGKFIVIAAEKLSQKILEKMKQHKYGKNAAVIGRVLKDPAGRVLMRTAIGSTRVIDFPSGEMLPRIC